tara:strand:- start:1388 stop:2980 length:1593 start_codon:yes stop_codon:yes gene_type:complete
MLTSFFKKNSRYNRGPSTEELIERGFAPKNGRIDILFVFPPTSIAARYGKKDIGEDIVGGNSIPLGIASLAAYVREKGYGVGVLECPGLGIDANRVHEVIKEKDPAIIAFSSTTYRLLETKKIAKRIRSDFPNKLIVLGGSHANVAGIETASESDLFDVIPYGLDGEYIIHDIVKKYSEKNFNRTNFMEDSTMLESIKGIIFKKNNKVIRNAAREVIKDLDELPFPARDLFPLERYIPLPNQYKQLPATNMLVIRGCPYFCTFCDQAGTGARRRSPKKVVEEIKHCVEKYGVKEISFWDDTLSYHKKWMKEFLNLLIEANLNLCWSCYAAVNTVDKEILQLMSKAGCWNIFYGFETAVPALAENILTNRKNRDFDRMKQVAKWTREAGIQYRGSFMFGMPGETPELAKQTIQNAIDLDPDYAQFGVVCPFPGTQIAKEIKEGKWGKIIENNLEVYNGWKVTWLPHGYNSPEELEDMERYAYKKFYMRPSYILKRILKIRSFEDLKRYIKGGIALIKGGYLARLRTNVIDR